MSAYHHGTGHHNAHRFTGWGIIIGLPFVLVFAALAIASGPLGLIAWLSTPLGAIGLLAFVTAAMWYCKLELDAVIMDYFDGGVRASGLLANKVAAIMFWALIAGSVTKLAFL